MMETEIWPNLLRECRARGVKTVMINGRISSRSYPRYRLIRPFFRRVLGRRRSLLHAERGVGAPRSSISAPTLAHVTVTGSLKFDSLELPAPAVARQAARARAAVLPRGAGPHGDRRRQHACAAKRRPVLRAFARIKATHADARCWCSRRAIPSASARSSGSRATPASSPTRRSELPIDAEPRADVVVLDTLGELAQLYQLATAVFVGGSLVDHGGHNILEPAIFGKPIVFGPHMQNFKEIADGVPQQRRRGPGAVGVASSTRRCSPLVTDPVRRARLGAAARALVEANRGAKNKTLAVIAELLPPPGRPSRRRPSLPTGALIQALSAAYSAAAAWRRQWYARHPSRRRRLARPVVSVGNLRVGGSGKTPVVAYIARLLLEHGERPAILTRGYGRRRADGRRAPSSRTATRRARRTRRRRRRAADARARASGRRRRSSAPIGICPAAWPSSDLARRFTSSTTDFSISSWRATSICCSCREDDLHDRPLPAGRLREASRRGERPLTRRSLPPAMTTAAERIGRALARRHGVSRHPRRSARRGWSAAIAIPWSCRTRRACSLVAGIARPERFCRRHRVGAGWDIVGTIDVPRSSPLRLRATSPASPRKHGAPALRLC